MWCRSWICNETIQHMGNRQRKSVGILPRAVPRYGCVWRYLEHDALRPNPSQWTAGCPPRWDDAKRRLNSYSRSIPFASRTRLSGDFGPRPSARHRESGTNSTEAIHLSKQIRLLRNSDQTPQQMNQRTHPSKTYSSQRIWAYQLAWTRICGTGNYF